MTLYRARTFEEFIDIIKKSQSTTFKIYITILSLDEIEAKRFDEAKLMIEAYDNKYRRNIVIYKEYLSKIGIELKQLPIGILARVFTITDDQERDSSMSGLLNFSYNEICKILTEEHAENIENTAIKILKIFIDAVFLSSIEQYIRRSLRDKILGIYVAKLYK